MELWYTKNDKKIEKFFISNFFENTRLYVIWSSESIFGGYEAI